MSAVHFLCTVSHTLCYYCGFTFNEMNAKRRLFGERERPVWQISYVLEEKKKFDSLCYASSQKY